MDNLSSLTNKDFRSTFVIKAPHKERTEEAENTPGKVKALSKHKNYGSKHNLDKGEEDGMLPKITGNSNMSNMMETYKKTLYNKKFSNDLNHGFQSRRAN